MGWWKDWIDSFNNVVELPDPLITELHSKGYSYDEEKEWWVRVWSTDTPEGKEEVLEVYKKEDDKWRQLMYGKDGELFYESEVTNYD